MRHVIYVLSLVALFGFPPVHAGDATKAVVNEGVRAAFEEFERQMIKKYFKDHPEYRERYHDDYNGHPGKKPKKKGLPPGIAMKLERGGTLPPGIAKKQLPPGLEGNLPAPPHGYERTVVGNDVVLVEADTGRIADIITDVILGK
ncbi:MAG TPA: RcnB family protein [Gammaproteobacteria bacterium]|nr:RcnB family protein [Gammaproteobacteria bacterium]